MTKFILKFILSFVFCSLSIVSFSQKDNELLYKELGNSNKSKYTSIFTQMSKNALITAPRQALGYALASERFSFNDSTKLLAHIAQIEAYMQLGKYQQALDIINKALELKNNAHKEKLYCFVGQANKELGNYDEANSFYQKALAKYIINKDSTEIAQVYQWIGSLLLRQNKITEAQLFYSKAYSIYIQRNDSNAIATNLSFEALTYRQSGKYNEALNIIEKGFQYTQYQSIDTKANFHHLRASIYLLQHNYEASLSDFETALALRKKSKNTVDLAATLLSISSIYKETNQYQKGIQLLNKALFLKMRLADTLQIVTIYNAIGGFNLRFNIYDKALLNYLRALELSYKNNNTNELSSLLMNIGTLYYELNDTKKADDYLHKALENILLPRDKNKLALLFTHLGNNYRKITNYSKSIEYYQKSLTEKSQLNDNLGVASVLLNIGAAYQEWGKYEQALIHTHKALSVYKSQKNILGEANTLNQLGNIYNNLNKKNEAQLYFKLTRKLSLNNKLLYLEALSSRKEAEIELLNNNLNKAFTLINNSIQIGRSLSNTELIRKGQYVLHDYYTKLNDYKSALSAFKIYAEYSDSLNKKQNQKQIIQLQMNFEIASRDSKIDEAEVKIDNLNKEKEKRNYELKIQRNLQYLWITITILLLISAISLIRSYQLKKKAAILLEEKFAISEDSNQKLRKSEEELRTLNNTKDKFFSIIAHDLKNPLGGLVSLTELMMTNFSKLEEEQKKEIVVLINQSSRQINTLLTNLLHWSRVQLGKMPFRPEILNMNNCITECFDLQSINASSKNISLINQSSINDTVWADPNMISLVLRNLVSNAVKFTPRNGQVTISTTMISTDTLQVSISDTGQGLTEEEKAKLFRLDINFTTSGTENEPGTGLGLILCKECIERHGGKIWVESEYSKGCNFIFTLKTTQNV